MVLTGRVGVYVLVSTDAVYDVSEKYHGGRSREGDSRNEPKDQKTRDQLEENNQYGASKKEVEQRLIEQKEKFGFPYVILRLADAIGNLDYFEPTLARLIYYKLRSNLRPRR